MPAYRPFVNGQMRPLPMPISNRPDPQKIQKILGGKPLTRNPLARPLINQRLPEGRPNGFPVRNISDTIPGRGGLRANLAKDYGAKMLAQLQQVSGELPPDLAQMIHGPQASRNPAATWKLASRQFAELTPNENPRVALARLLANQRNGTLAPDLYPLRKVPAYQEPFPLGGGVM